VIRTGQTIHATKVSQNTTSKPTLKHRRPLIRPDRKDKKPRIGNFGDIRQWLESVFDTLKSQLSLEKHIGRTLSTVYPGSGRHSAPAQPRSDPTG
jgi:hypothetical protein